MCRRFQLPADGSYCKIAFAPANLAAYATAVGSLNFYIKSAAAGAVPAFLKVIIEGTGPTANVLVGSYLANFDANWQLVTIPMSVFTGMSAGWATTTVFAMSINGGAGVADFQVDNVTFTQP